MLTLNQIIMKHSLLAANLFIIAAVMTSCQKEQSELHLDSLQSKAVITGTVEYVVGDYKLDDAIISGYKLPAAGQTVMVTVPTSDYADQASGKQYFEVTTDENGNYTVEIPVGVESLSATVTVLPFHAQKDFAQNDLTVVSIPDALYNNVTDRNLTLEQKKIYTADLVVSSDEELPVAFDQEIEIKGKASVESWVRDSEVDASAYDYYKAGTSPLERTEVEIKVEISTRGEVETTMAVIASTDSNGEYSAIVKLPTDCWDKTTEITASIEASLMKNFTHRYCYYESGEYVWRTQNIDQVIYEATSVSTNLSATNKLVPVTMNDMLVQTEPVDNSGIYGVTVNETPEGISIPSNYNNKLDWPVY